MNMKTGFHPMTCRVYGYMWSQHQSLLMSITFVSRRHVVTMRYCKANPYRRRNISYVKYGVSAVQMPVVW